MRFFITASHDLHTPDTALGESKKETTSCTHILYWECAAPAEKLFSGCDDNNRDLFSIVANYSVSIHVCVNPRFRWLNQHENPNRTKTD